MFDLKQELLRIEKRLSSKNKKKILRVSEEEGWSSCYLYLEHLIYEVEMKPKLIREKLGIEKYVYYGMANKISLLKRDNVVQEESQKFQKKIVKNKMCGYCGKRKRVGAYYCRVCLQRANQVSKQIDLDMMGDY